MSVEQTIPDVNATTRELYDALLSCADGLLGPVANRCVRSYIDNNARWSQHWESLRFLDLERTAAAHDARQLADFRRNPPTHLPVHEQLHLALADMWNRSDPENWISTVPEVLNRIDQEEHCVFCRRMLRWGLARVEAERLREQCPDEVVSGELLVRDWVIEGYLRQELARAIPVGIVVNESVKQFSEIRHGAKAVLQSKVSFDAQLGGWDMRLRRDRQSSLAIGTTALGSSERGRERIEFSSEITEPAALLDVAFEIRKREALDLVQCSASYQPDENAPHRNVSLVVELSGLPAKSKRGEGRLEVAIECMLTLAIGRTWRVRVSENNQVHATFAFDLRAE